MTRSFAGPWRDLPEKTASGAKNKTPDVLDASGVWRSWARMWLWILPGDALPELIVVIDRMSQGGFRTSALRGRPLREIWTDEEGSVDSAGGTVCVEEREEGGCKFVHESHFLCFS